MDDELLSHYPPPAAIRSSHRWRKLRDQFRDHCERTGARCWWCVLRGDIEHAAIDYNAPARSPWAFEADHVNPVDQRPDLAYAWANLAPSHMRCNRQKGTKSYATQGEWVKPPW
jgi:5-methylcytosine-specific restriction endonuclease McrA